MIHSVSDLVSLFSQDDSDSEVSDSDLAISLSNHHMWHFQCFSSLGTLAAEDNSWFDSFSGCFWLFVPEIGEVVRTFE